ncbi:sensor histidine kinase [Aquisediminimonas profunda]|uniref:sensor histidine kinase n=1 Tax=Aquisediminimonas profunda TaxID=1550733 RepID=UPI001C632F6A|nr:HAMP domain-containing sensor histidine kinase [Aquisediminimonas profunda]
MLTQSAPDGAARAALWVQIADIVAQERIRISPEKMAAAFERLLAWREDVPVSRRRATALALSDHPVSPEMVDLFAKDSPQVAAPLLLHVKLDDQDWVRLIPGWPSTSRALVRERRDLPDETRRLLGVYGNVDFVLPGGSETADSHESAIQIRDLVARIEAYRRDHRPAARSSQEPERLEFFRFEAGGDGIINWVEGAPRGPLIGISLADMAEPGGYGVDGQAAGACRQRAQFRDAHLTVAGAGEASGAWLLSANPLFNREDGRFIGYRGFAKRPGPSLAAPSKLLGDGLSPDSIRQLTHELRTPLNAIRGFGEMIESRLLGPVAQHYREMARSIVSDASRLMAVIDDLDSAARLETGDWPVEALPAEGISLSTVLESIASELGPLSDDHGARIRIVLVRPVPNARADLVTCRRLVGRLLTAAIELAVNGEELIARLDVAGTGVTLQVDRPSRIQGLTPEQILATAAVGDASSAGDIALGLGFTMRLIEAMAKRAGGSLEIGRERISLVLPSVTAGAEENKESG